MNGELTPQEALDAGALVKQYLAGIDSRDPAKDDLLTQLDRVQLEQVSKIAIGMLRASAGNVAIELSCSPSIVVDAIAKSTGTTETKAP